MQFEEPELVLRAQQMVGNEGGARINARIAPRIESAHHIQVALNRGCQCSRIARDQPQHAFGRLAAGAGVVAVEPIEAGTGMGVDHRQRCLLFEQVVEDGDQHRVLEHVGVIAGMEGMAVTEHGPMVTGNRAGAPG